MYYSTWSAQFILRKTKSWVCLQIQPEAIHKLITGQNEIEQTNDLVELAHRGRHRFMNPVVRAMETNSKKLGTPSSISWSIQIKSRQQVLWVHSTTQNIEYKHYAGNRAPFHKRVKAQKSTPMLIRWQIVTQTTQNISDKPSLHTFNLVHITSHNGLHPQLTYSSFGQTKNV
jgi:hypothetical protein